MGYTDTENTWEPLIHLIQFGGRELVWEYAAGLDNDDLNNLLPKYLQPKSNN
jgi:hypothetical protein